MDALSIKNLNVVLGAQQVLRDVTFDIKKGELAAVIGPNGSGKTTLFRAILGLIPYSGEIKVLGKPAAQGLDKIGYVPQHFDFDRTVPITVSEFLSFSEPKIKGKSQESICREVRVDVLHDKLLGELSGGQLQRVLIANALFKNPSILLLDEPSAGIDIEGAQAFYELVEHLNGEHGVTVLLISHEVSFVHRLADRVICVNKDLICDGVPEKVLDQATLKKLYGSDITGHIH
ncbi:MAG: metal ABC transporter ATP-binding protein [Patescibacteria group bacterium]